MDERVATVIQDAQSYAARFDVTIADEALDVIRGAEELACELNTYLYPWTVMAVLLAKVRVVRAALARLGSDPNSAAETFEAYTRELGEEEQIRTQYDPEDSYSAAKPRHLSTRPKMIDKAVEIARKNATPIRADAFREPATRS